MIHFVVPLQQAGGVYDFACKLQGAIGHDAVRIVHLSRDDAAGWEIGPDDTVFLQLSGYGFDKRGAPFWLLREVEKRRKQIRTLGVFFHELYALGPPWTSSFFLSPVQRHIARRLAELSDFWMTSREGSAQWLRRFAGDKQHVVLPVFSNVGEAPTLPQSRLRRVVVFGSPGLRSTTYQAAGRELFAWAKRAAFEVHDIGAPIQDASLVAAHRANGVIQHGRLENEEISSLMKTSTYGLLAYPVDYVAKSSVFAAYCTHGVCPVLWSKEYAAADGLVADRHYLRGLPADLSTSAVTAAIGESAWAWYQPHRLAAHAASLQQLMAPQE